MSNGPGIEFVGIDESVIRELAEGRHAREVMELSKIKKEFSALSQSPIGQHRSVEGLGRPVLSVPPLAYHYWRERLGPDCWADRQFQREFARDNPGARVEQASGGSSNKVGWNGRPKFKKSYSWPCEL